MVKRCQPQACGCDWFGGQIEAAVAADRWPREMGWQRWQTKEIRETVGGGGEGAKVQRWVLQGIEWNSLARSSDDWRAWLVLG